MCLNKTAPPDVLEKDTKHFSQEFKELQDSIDLLIQLKEFHQEYTKEIIEDFDEILQENNIQPNHWTKLLKEQLSYPYRMLPFFIQMNNSAPPEVVLSLIKLEDEFEDLPIRYTDEELESFTQSIINLKDEKLQKAWARNSLNHPELTKLNLKFFYETIKSSERKYLHHFMSLRQFGYFLSPPNYRMIHWTSYEKKKTIGPHGMKEKKLPPYQPINLPLNTLPTYFDPDHRS